MMKAVVKYGKGKGLVEIREVPEPKIKDDEVLIEVSDRGSGMTAEFIRDRLFRPFQTTKDMGMGIGAFECQQYVQQVGGSIEVQSQPDVGTQVRVRLRAVAELETLDGAVA